MADALKIKKKEIDHLSEQVVTYRKDLENAIKEAIQVKDRSKKQIQDIQDAMELAHKEFLEYIQELQKVRDRIDK